MAVMTACSTTPGQTSGEQISRSGPSVVDARAINGTIELNKSFQTSRPAEIVANVKDFSSKIKDVRLRFLHAPLEVPMKYQGGTTWRAELSKEQLKLLAVSGQTMRYDANVIATNANGQVAMSREPVEISIKAPEVVRSTG